MKLEDQVCSFDQARKLTELGVTLDTTFHWECFNFETPKLAYLEAEDVIALYDYPESFYPALTVAELGVLLQPYTVVRNVDNGKIYWRLLDDYYLPKWESKAPLFYKDTEAEGRAEALIWLIENGYVMWLFPQQRRIEKTDIHNLHIEGVSK